MRCDRANEAFAEAGLTMADIDGLTVAGICETVPTLYGSIRQSRQAAPPALMPWPPSNPTGRVFLYDRQLTPSVVEEQVEWIEASGKGGIYSYTAARRVGRSKTMYLMRSSHPNRKKARASCRTW